MPFIRYIVHGVRSRSREQRRAKMVVSLTTFPLRIGKVHLTIQSILRQSRPADRILLWLSKEEFPEEAQLPANLLRLKEKGLDIRFCDNIRSFKRCSTPRRNLKMM